MQLIKYELLRSINIQIPITNSGVAGQQVQFPDQPYLRNKKIVSIMASGAAFSPNSSQANLFYNFVSTSAPYPCFLTFYDSDGKQFIQNMPVIDLMVINYIDSTNLANNFIYNTDGILTFNPTAIVWPKSYMYFPAGVGFSNRTACFNVYYLND